jgi:integrase
MAALRAQAGVSARALEFAVLTATRTSEVIGATWDEFDLERKLWTVPAERMKAKKEHRVPLSPRAVEVLRVMQELHGGRGIVFPGVSGKKPLSNMALLMTLRRMERNDITAHGFRSTFRDWAAEMTAYPRDVAEMALAHTISDKVEAAYRRGDLFTKRQQMMDEWAGYCGQEESK